MHTHRVRSRFVLPKEHLAVYGMGHATRPHTLDVVRTVPILTNSPEGEEHSAITYTLVEEEASIVVGVVGNDSSHPFTTFRCPLLWGLLPFLNRLEG